MKISILKNLLIFAVTLSFVVFTSCEPTDSNKDYGFTKIYIPQATVTGLDNSYPIPLGPFGQNSSYSCYYENGTLNIAVGVMRSGDIAEPKGFSVDFKVSQSETDRKLNEYVAKNTPATVLPEASYSIPSKIVVESGNNNATVYIPVDLRKLAEDREALVKDGQYKLLVLGLEISNPTAFELSDSNTSIVVVLDFNSKHWDNIPESLPECEVRAYFPKLN